MKRSFLLVSVLGSLAIPVLAQSDVEAPRGAVSVSRADVEQRVETRFAAVDLDSDGYVDKDEATTARAAAQGKMADRRFDRLDRDKDGAISRAEFAERAQGARPRPMLGRKLARMGAMRGRMFERMDADADGRVSLAEAKAMPLRWFGRIDANNDGIVTADERRAAREARRAARQSRG